MYLFPIWTVWRSLPADGGTNLSMRSGTREAGSLIDRGGHREEVIGPGGFEQLQDTRCDARGDEVDSLVLAADKMADDQSQATGIHIGNFSEVEDVDPGSGVGRIGLEHVAQGDGSECGVHVASSERARETKDDCLVGRVILALDGEGGTFPDFSLHTGHSISRD